MYWARIGAVAAAVLALQGGGGAAAQAPQSHAVLTLPAGAPIELMVVREVNSDRARPGDPVKLRVNRPVTIDGVEVVPVGTAAQGEVTASKKSGMLLQRGKLAVKLNAITLDGRTILLGSDFKQSAKGGQADDVLKLVLVPEWLLFARGNSARLKAGELLTAEVAEDVCFAPGDRGYIPASCPVKAETAQAVQ